MKPKDRVKLRKQESRQRYQERVNRRADDAARNPYVRGSFAGYNVLARSVVIQTPHGGRLRGVAVKARSLGRRITVQRGGKGHAL